MISNIDILCNLIHFNNLMKKNYSHEKELSSIHEYIISQKIIKLRSEIKNNIFHREIIHLYIELYKYLYELDIRLKEIFGDSHPTIDYPSQPIYYILLSDDLLHLIVH